MGKLISLKKIRKYDDKGRAMSKEEQVADLANRTIQQIKKEGVNIKTK